MIMPNFKSASLYDKSNFGAVDRKEVMLIQLHFVELIFERKLLIQ